MPNNPGSIALDDSRLLAFAEKLQAATSIADLLEISADEVREVIGYQTTWIAVFDFEKDTVRMLAAQSDRDVDIWTHAPVFPISADPYMVRIASSTTPQIVRDAQTDPDVNRAIVEALGNRTIVNVPLWLMDQPFGALGTGSFGDEGVLVPTSEQLEYFQAIANQLVVASARIVLLRQREEAAAESARVQRLLEQRGRLAALGQLAGGVAHDFNNLLTVILASADYVREASEAPELRDELDLILEATQRAADLTKQLLTLGKRQHLQLTEIAPGPLMTSLVDMMRRVIPANIDVRLTTPAGLPRLVADRSQLEQVVTNLCLNARDAMPDGGTLSLDCERVELSASELPHQSAVEPGDFLRIRVSDTGAGMSAELIDRIFEPFFTTKEPDKGTGLGLAMCQGVVEQHEGFIRVDSKLGEGTQFRVYLPMRRLPSNSKAAGTASTTISGNERILVADDQPHVRRAVERTLALQGYKVTAVPDGAAAIDAARRESFDLVILDAIMPRVGGRGAYDEIRELRPGARFLFASGYGAEEMTARFLADTQVTMLQKPFAPATLLTAVRRVLDSPGD